MECCLGGEGEGGMLGVAAEVLNKPGRPKVMKAC